MKGGTISAIMAVAATGAKRAAAGAGGDGKQLHAALKAWPAGRPSDLIGALPDSTKALSFSEAVSTMPFNTGTMWHLVGLRQCLGEQGSGLVKLGDFAVENDVRVNPEGRANSMVAISDDDPAVGRVTH